MDKKIALVIGGSGGIGSEIVKSLVKKDMKVCSTYYKNEKNAKKSFQELNNVSLYLMDLCNNTSVNTAFNQIIKDHNIIDIIVFSVTFPTKNKQILSMEWKDFEEHINLQIKGFFNVIQNLKEQIKERHKTKFVIILTEYCIGKPPQGLSDYITAKYGLMGFAKSMAVELAKYNCTVNMVSPGMVETNLISNLPPKLIEITAENNPLKRIASPEDIANVVLFLSSDNSDYLNGVNIIVNGGGILL